MSICLYQFLPAGSGVLELPVLGCGMWATRFTSLPSWPRLSHRDRINFGLPAQELADDKIETNTRLECCSRGRFAKDDAIEFAGPIAGSLYDLKTCRGKFLDKDPLRHAVPDTVLRYALNPLAPGGRFPIDYGQESAGFE